MAERPILDTESGKHLNHGGSALLQAVINHYFPARLLCWQYHEAVFSTSISLPEFGRSNRTRHA